jgi:hypothetical protein
MQHSYSRRRFVGLLGGAVAVAATPSWGRFVVDRAAAHSLEATGTSEPVGPADQVILRIEYKGGFVPVESLMTTIPAFTMYADGRVITTGPMIEIFPQPALPNLRQLKLTPDGVQRVRDAAEAAGLADGSKSYDSSAITDVQSTVFTYGDGSSTNVVSAYALGFDEPTVSEPEDLEARADLINLQSFLGNLSGELPPDEIAVPDAPYEIESIRIYARSYDESIVDPELVQVPMVWPLSIPLSEVGEPIGRGPLAETKCGTIGGGDAERVVAALAQSNQLTPWESGGETYQLWARPLLPDESGCPEQ